MPEPEHPCNGRLVSGVPKDPESQDEHGGPSAEDIIIFEVKNGQE